MDNRFSKRKIKNFLIGGLITLSFLIILIPLVSLIFTNVVEGAGMLSGDFLSKTMRGVVGGSAPYGGIYHAIMGTLEVTLGAMIISIPIGILCAIYLNEYSQYRKKDRKLAKWINNFVDIMSGIPSIVAGLFAYAIFALIFGPGTVFGFVGSAALAILMLPTVIRGTGEMLRLVPNELREASLGLGVSKTRTILSVVLRSAIPGIITTVLLAIARVIGETAPLLITVGSVDNTNTNLFGGRMETLPVYIYNEYSQGLANCSANALLEGCRETIHYDRAWAAALVLVAIVLILNILGKVLGKVLKAKER
jgi:phosphate transport system permease protein